MFSDTSGHARRRSTLLQPRGCRSQRASDHKSSYVIGSVSKPLGSRRIFTVILALRLHAMYCRIRIILVACTVVLICEALVLAILFGYPRSGLTCTSLIRSCYFLGQRIYAQRIAGNNPAPGVYICADGDPIDGHWISYYWTTILVVNTIFLGLSLYKAQRNWRCKYATTMLRMMARDSVLFFFAYVRQQDSNMQQRG